jgi:alanine racemase
MDQIILDCGDDPVAPGDVAVLFGPGDDGTPTATDWAEAIGTINYEIVTRFGGTRVPRVYDGTAGLPPDPAPIDDDPSAARNIGGATGQGGNLPTEGAADSSAGETEEDA